MANAIFPKLPVVRTSSARRTLAAVALLLASTPAIAYVGPGAGLSLAGAVWGLVVAVVAAVGFIVLWPIRRHLKRRRAGRVSDTEYNAQPDSEADTSMAQEDGPTAEVHRMNEQPGSATGRVS